MNRIFRTAGVTAASLCFVAAIASAAPSRADEANIAYPAPVFTDHASATLADPAAASQPNLAQPASPVGMKVRAVGQAIKALLPGDQYPAAPRPPAVSPAPLTLHQLVGGYSGHETMDAEKDCLARAVYYEARGEPLEGQLAVANVVLNRAASGRYPTSLCAVVRQPAQFSFVRRGHIPAAPRNAAWARAVGIAHVAAARFADGLSSNVLWYHADYVAPSWGRRLTRVTKIGAHIFYS